MQINTLEISDFRVFRGNHAITLAPREKYGKRRPIVLFGGLNGAGKTSILTAVRLALYGKQAVGKAVSQKQYEEFLRDSIHRSPASLVNSDSARVALDFTHSNLGEVSNYIVSREWTLKGKSVSENLAIIKDGKALNELSYDQCQSFLNELVPIGVSDLFFFDGEKISELADEGGTVALGGAIKRLLGLDLVERLGADLSTYMRREAVEQLPEAARLELDTHETKYKEIEVEIARLNNEKSFLNDHIVQLEKELSELERQFAAKGGAWAGERADLHARRELLDGQRTALENSLRELLGGLYPLSLAPELLGTLDEQLKSETAAKQTRIFSQALELKLPDLVDTVTNEVGERSRPDFRDLLERTLRNVLRNAFGEDNKAPPLHDLSDTEQSRLVTWIHEATGIIPGTVARLRSELERVSEELSTVALQIERVPDEAYLAQELSEIKALQTNIGITTERRRATAETIRNLAWQAIELLRSMRRLETRATTDRQQRNTYGLANRTKGLLVDFAADLRRRKIQSLQSNFRDAFMRLARKSDVILRVEIDPDTFDVTLFGKNGKPIPRNRLSAGEKQIYAIAMLESLMKTSGRALPVIVDTPLGRLDSKHRDKLVNSYFPVASHQTILLSTDTEVDERFYETLSPHISHAFHVAYDQGEHFSTINEGYFWRQKEVGR